MTDGLNLINTQVKKLSEMKCNKKLPHVGWNDIKMRKKCEILKDIPNNLDFYFVHSYAMENGNFVVVTGNHLLEINSNGDVVLDIGANKSLSKDHRILYKAQKIYSDGTFSHD